MTSQLYPSPRSHKSSCVTRFSPTVRQRPTWLYPANVSGDPRRKRVLAPHKTPKFPVCGIVVPGIITLFGTRVRAHPAMWAHTSPSTPQPIPLFVIFGERTDLRCGERASVGRRGGFSWLARTRPSRASKLSSRFTCRSLTIYICSACHLGSYARWGLHGRTLFATRRLP